MYRFAFIENSVNTLSQHFVCTRISDLSLHTNKNFRILALRVIDSKLILSIILNTLRIVA
jgi:hypothetical protein